MKTGRTQDEIRLGEQMARDFIGWNLGYVQAARRAGLDFDAVLEAFYAALDKLDKKAALMEDNK